MPSEPEPHDDRYDAWYAEKLWLLLPALYRAEDSADFNQAGPLEELVTRIGAQAAVVRRSIDRLWEDQSIETCDDWIIDYIGDLLATNLVASLDARGKRLDVGRTINYRRRKGTVALLEELATDITGWSARVVEMFRRLGRHRHGLDPELRHPARSPAPPAPPDPRALLQETQGFYGARTRTPAGGFADLRDVHGAALASDTAFDEYAHTADVRRGRGNTGWHGIPRVGVFVWRLRSFRVAQGTPVEKKVGGATCTGAYRQYTFDPTGRDAPLFARGDHAFGDEWISPQPHQMPGPITPPLLAAAFAALYGSSVGVFHLSVPDYALLPDVAPDPRPPRSRPWIDPALGRIIYPTAPTSPPRVDYHFGFSSEIGAGPYERPAIADPLDRAAIPAAQTTVIADPATAITATGTRAVVLGGSRTYRTVAALTAIDRVELRAQDQQRPVIRPGSAGPWSFEGAGPDATLVLDGLLVSGGADVILTGEFAHVTVSCCTLDPGTWDPAPPPPDTAPRWGVAIDGVALQPTHLRIRGKVRELVIDRSMTGPILVEAGGRVARLTVRESIVQAADPAPVARAIVVPDGEATLERATLLGAADVHRFDASECILEGAVTVDDHQHGCVRFSAYAPGGRLPRQYRSHELDLAPRFASRAFGQPAYAQLLATAGAAIAEGAADGSEMGAFWREQNAIKERSLLLKYHEYLPLGMEPVVVHVT
jgi:hypothetical protein